MTIFRSRSYLKHIRSFACLICGREGEHAHHLRHAEQQGWGIKNSDEFAVPLCAKHHMDCHTTGNESLWWALHGIDALSWATLTYEEFNNNLDKGGEK